MMARTFNTEVKKDYRVHTINNKCKWARKEYHLMENNS